MSATANIYKPMFLINYRIYKTQLKFFLIAHQIMFSAHPYNLSVHIYQVRKQI
jgi:hypothetical protein